MKKVLILLILVFLPFQVFAIEKWKCDFGISFLQCGGPLIPQCPKEGCGFNDLRELICNIIKFIANCIAQVVVMFRIAWGGFTIMFAAGDPEKIKKGKEMIIHALVGLFIVILAGNIITMLLEL